MHSINLKLKWYGSGSKDKNTTQSTESGPATLKVHPGNSASGKWIFNGKSNVFLPGQFAEQDPRFVAVAAVVVVADAVVVVDVVAVAVSVVAPGQVSVVSPVAEALCSCP